MINKSKSAVYLSESLLGGFSLIGAMLIWGMIIALSDPILAVDSAYFYGQQVPDFRASKSTPMPEHDRARRAMQHGKVMPYYALKKKVEKKINAKIIGEKLRHTNRGWIYDLRVRGRRGKVSSVIVNAQTAEIYIMK